MRIVLKQGDVIQIEVEDGDGVITVGYGTEELYVDADMPDSDNRNGRIYSERFGEPAGKRYTNAQIVDMMAGAKDGVDDDEFLDKVMEEAAEAELESEEFDQAILEDPVGDDPEEGELEFDTRPVARRMPQISDDDWDEAIRKNRDIHEA